MERERKEQLILVHQPNFFNSCSKTTSYSIPIKCLARSDAGPQSESDAVASFTSTASLVDLERFPSLRRDKQKGIKMPTKV